MIACLHDYNIITGKLLREHLIEFHNIKYTYSFLGKCITSLQEDLDQQNIHPVLMEDLPLIYSVLADWINSEKIQCNAAQILKSIHTWDYIRNSLNEFKTMLLNIKAPEIQDSFLHKTEDMSTITPLISNLNNYLHKISCLKRIEITLKV